MQAVRSTARPRRRRRAPSRRRARLVAAVAIAALVALAVVVTLLQSHTSQTRTGPPVATTAPAGSPADIGTLRTQYLSAIGTFNQTVTPFQQVVDSMADQPNADALRRAAQAVLPGLRADTANIAAIGWPQSIRFDVNTFVTAEATVESLLQSTPADNSGLRTWIQRWGLAKGQVDNADLAIRRDVGITIPSNS